MPRLTDERVEELDREGFVIVPDFLTGDRLRVLQEAQRRLLPIWEEVKDDIAEDQNANSRYVSFPHEEMEFYRLAMDEESVAFARKWLRTDAIHCRVGSQIARYPGHGAGGVGFDGTQLHIDNGNNSLLPVSETHREFGQIWFWIHLEDVEGNQAPLRLIPKRHGTDMSKCVGLVCKGGTLCIFTTYTWHSATAYVREDGQRFTCAYSFGRADHYWEGLLNYTHIGKSKPVFQKFIGGLTAEQRELWRFPPAGNRYYTEQTLALLEEQYPGWNSDEYRVEMKN